MKRLAYALIFVFALCGAVLGASIMRSISQSEATAGNDLSSLSIQPHPGARLPLSQKLTDESGRAVELGAYFTKSPVILVLEYLRCTSLCGVTLRNLIGDTLKQLPLQPGRDYQLVAISIDPRDKPSDAAAAAAKYVALLDRGGGKAGVHFLTGEPAAVRRIADTIGFAYRYDSLLDAYIHPAGFVVAAPDGVISHYVEGFTASSSDMIDAFASAAQDKSQGPLTRLLLLCHIQGAPLGRWTVAVIAAFTFANVGAGLTVAVIFAAIRRRRHG
ncbi:MAG: SCO family protein [Bradyrhizobium sp.]|uniref:SCO family protein n=1 Tax=Bradyrhizobium sp. TaxID=376 RepID=UPI002396B15A|nr:SCO family protein [Bradyrhizobium sp.]MDE2069520.1 SCO family protein [Bradyrhizobium sp.]MDE2243889.1 SCO family protein [Bradyrhizobium sp.]